LCINCAEGFSESGYQRIGQTVINGINQEVNNESLVSIAEESRSIYGTQTELSGILFNCILKINLNKILKLSM
jgi:hypothetical protein